MKKENNFLANVLRLYILTFLALQLYLFLASKPCKSTAEPLQAPTGLSLNYNSSRFDNSHLVLTGVVSQSGNFFFDCMFISTYRIVLPDGYGITVYTRGSVPEEGNTITTCGTFRQLYHGKTISNWSGLMEHERRAYRPELVNSAQ